MAQHFQSIAELRELLIEYFSLRFRISTKKIEASANLKVDIGLSEAEWTDALVGMLAMPQLAAFRLNLGPTEIQNAVSIPQLVDRIRLSIAKGSGGVVQMRVEDKRKFLSPDRQNNTEITLWYATNRKLNDSEDASQGYSSERDTAVHYGTCNVFVPASHKIGSLGSSWIRRLVTGVDDRLSLKKISALDSSRYWSEIREYMASLSADQRHALVFVHGYNVSFKDAALRSAQLGCDLSVNGVMAFFSWPSRGSLRGYAADEATIEASEPLITQFLSDVVALSGASKVHIIAHSMGNRGVLRAINNIVTRAKPAVLPAFGQIVLAAADVDAGTFHNMSSSYVSASMRTTLYASARDRAVEASRWLHSFTRAGLLPPVSVFSGIDTVSVTNADITMLGHGYVGEAREVLSDIHELIVDNKPPAQRFGLRELVDVAGQTYWEIGK